MSSRRTIDVTIERDGRDKGKTFRLTEMAAGPATDWFMRAMGLIARGGVDVPADLFEHGPAGMVALGIGACLAGMGRAPWAEAKPLFDELLDCVAFVTPNGTAVISGPQARTQIEEIWTQMQLYEEVVSLHLGFSLAAKLSTFRDFAAQMITAFTLSTGTSTESSE